ncbi:hypothetical protein GCM10027451_33380 [Geodermatophilus aquaeductus]|uniref:Protein NO VEIN C-terminal domain-containing protein n=1 Tax=Geodermatophilus aquaeductus TaxID=1564161 RepID=A0A521EX14_9ACTN|nr:DUF3883 domain-containing protein [Geodermatophilus aquaeductus]SMO88455.1 protein of unknown function [Geodermatophilus aquaeductus]
MATSELRSPKQVEDAAISFVVQQEKLAGREAIDTRYQGAVADLVSGDRIIEVKAAGTSFRGQDLWLETRQVQAARADPDRFWLYLVENVRQGDPAHFRLLRVGGEQLQQLMAKARERHYYEVPLPVAVYDAVLALDD